MVGILLMKKTENPSCPWAPTTPAPSAGSGAPPPPPQFQPDRIAQLVACEPIMRNYPYALNALLEELAMKTTLKLDPQPVMISSFETTEIFKCPFIYVNFADRQDWNLSELEKGNLRAYLDRGGFIFIDAGVNAEFLRKDSRFGQHHSYADWQVTPDLEKAFKEVYPGLSFKLGSQVRFKGSS